MRKLYILFIAAFTCMAAFGQVTTSSIGGNVADLRGEALIGATVKATHNPTGTVYANATLLNGNFNIAGMRVGGPYTIEVSYLGYITETLTDVYLTVGQEARFNFRLRESSVSMDEVVVVGVANPVFSSNRTGAQEVITQSMMEKLPSLNRSLDDFVKLTPMASGRNFAGASYRFTNVTVDGASFNNSFGLSSSLGASGIEAISLESIDQIQVMIAPYDVRNGGFTGGGINSVTKSGTNEFNVSAYMYTKSPDLTGYRQKDIINPVSEFSNKQYGVSVGGPIVRNKLFFFVNAEFDRIERPINWTTETPGSHVSANMLESISDFLKDELDYDPGRYNVSKTPTEADRITARLDWNINQKNTFSLKYYYLRSFNTNSPSTSGAPTNGRGPNQYAIPFSSTFYRANNNFNIVMGELNTTINERMSNTLMVGYSRLRDFRDMDGGFFPQVDILNGASTKYSYTAFGTEANSYNNQLDTDIFQIQDNFTLHLGKHQLTFGTQSDLRKFRNGFAQNYPGAWRFNSFNDFMFNVLATKKFLADGGDIKEFDITAFNPADFGISSETYEGSGIPVTGLHQGSFRQRFSTTDEFPFAYVDVFSLGLYVQDKWTVTDKFNVTLGLRMDMPIFLTKLDTNPAVASETYRDGIKVDVSKYPKARPLFSPRLGFNWKPIEDLQVRGGTGIFTGTPPYVWLSNQAGNNGILFGDFNPTSDEIKGLGFTGDIDTYSYHIAKAVRGDIAVTDEDFKYPSMWKTDLAVDYKFGDGWIATAEILYSKDINAIYHDNIGIYNTGEFVKDGSGQEVRPYFDGYYSNQPGNSEAANNVVLMRNTSKGYSFYTTLQLQKNFTHGVLRGLYLNGSYTFGKAKSVTDGSSSVATSAWRYRPALNPNAQELGFSSGAFDGRLLLSAYYTANWGPNASTSIGLTYERYRPFRYTYCYNGDANGDRIGENDPIYIPRNFSDVEGHLLAGDFDSVEDAWAALDAFIKQDPYLSKNRGKFAERNGAVAPWANLVNFSIYHDIKVPLANGKVNTLRFSFDIYNFLNLLNKDWGVQRTSVIGNQQFQFLNVVNGPSADNDYTLQYTMTRYLDKNKTEVLNKTFKDYNSSTSRWSAMFGIKYMFN